MPYANEHACRLIDPGEFVRFRRDNDKNPNVIVGFRQDGSSAAQSFRYPTDGWSLERARAHCREHDGSFEAAAKGERKDQATERRYVQSCELRIADAAEGQPRHLVGYAAVFDTLSESLEWGFREQIKPGAFKDVLAKGDDVRALVEHEGGLTTLGRRLNGTLALSEDKRGLLADIVPPDTQAGRDVIELIRRGDLSQMSFGFRVTEDGETWTTEKGEEIRTLNKIDRLFDVSIVGLPAYTDTSVALRSLDVYRKGLKRRDEDMRSAWKRVHLQQAKRRIGQKGG